MITFNQLEFIHEEIYPHIVVYKNLIRDVDAIYDDLKQERKSLVFYLLGVSGLVLELMLA